MATTRKATLRWNKKSYEVDVGDSLEELQAVIYSLTQVPPERQKLLRRGRQIKSDKDLTKVKPKAKLMMMGTADELKAPTKKYVFEEDLTDTQRAELAPEKFAGLVNLGNTCYMNSTVQCLRAIPELKSGLLRYQTEAGRAAQTDRTATMVGLMGRMFQELDLASSAVTPSAFVQVFRLLYPQFAQRGDSGHFMQQDADECLGTFMQAIGSRVEAKYGPDVASNENLARQLFGFEIETTGKCIEAETESPKVSTDTALKLRCNIDEKINFLVEGVQKNLVEVREVKSPTLNRNAQYEYTTRMKTLPPYLVVQFVRFFWKKGKNQKCKMLRKVKFPLRLDVESFVEDGLRKSISARRIKDKEERDKELGLDALQVGGPKGKQEAKASDESGAAPMEIVETVKPAATTGFYQLVGVVTHKGRAADSGHYIGWVHQEGEKWAKFDDEKVSPCTEDEVLALCGGGDWHTAYMAYYKRVDKMPPVKKKAKKKT